MVSMYDNNFREFAFTVHELQMLQCKKKMKFRNAWPRRYVTEVSENKIQLWSFCFGTEMRLVKHDS
jgi:hypothetical protein